VRTLGALLPDGALLPAWVAVPLTVVAIIGVTNAINLADGLDGLAGGISLLSFCCIGYLAYLEGDISVGLAALAFIGAIFGFLRFNTHPATIFMGDTGSQLLGFAAITLSLALTQRQTALSPLLPLILLGFPVLDTLTVMITRILRKRSPFSADRNHFHHNLLDLGFRHPESVPSSM
jgi:UDP-GlcNAc:undecaprenyl-phosphate GlcNAc-1-phosphate transferase